MAASPLPPDQDLFDEDGYLRLYPDIAQAVATGVIASGWQHYRRFGRRQGRRPNDVDASFYLDTYKQAAEDIAAARAADAASHFVRLGRARGYRPNQAVPINAAGVVSPVFPFLWTDLPHAPDLIEGRLALGRLTERDAVLLRRWVQDGFVVLDLPFDPRVVAAATLDLERGFAGACPDLLFSCGAVALGPVTWQPEINAFPAAALDLHYVSQPVRSLLFAEPVAAFLGLLFDAPALLTHSRGTLRDAAQGLQTDAGGPAYTLPRQFITAWFALHTASPESGGMHCVPGSHRRPADPTGAAQAEGDAPPQPIAIDRDRVVLRHPALLHGADAVPEGRTRRGILARYCPRYVLPLYAERGNTAIWRHDSQYFSTQIYPTLDPLD